MPDEGAPPIAGADGGREPAVHELAELRDLLFGGERRQLDELRRRLDTFELSPEELAEKLPQAIAFRAARDRHLALALAPTVEAAIGESVRRNPHEIATAIFPVLGPSIRKAIAETMAGLVNAINRGIEHSLSLRGIRWRIESWRTGVPFAQIVIRHALVYKVEQVFLVHSQTGLLLAHVPDDAPTDADLISGMLTAIGDFVADSFEPRHTGELRTFAVGDLSVLVEKGPEAYVAAVVRGQPPEALLGKLQTTVETIHLQWSAALASFSGDCSQFMTTRPLLGDCVETVLATDQPRAHGTWARFAWVIPVLLIAAGIVWWATRSGRRWDAAVSRLEAEPGIVVIRTERSGGRWHVAGMRDPLATNPAVLLGEAGIDSASVAARWEPYVSTEPELVLARARRALAPPAGVTLSLDGDALVAGGRAPAAWIERAEAMAPALAGVGSADFTRVTPGLPADMEPLAGRIEEATALFTVGSAALEDSARATAAVIAATFARLAAAARRNGFEVSLQLVGRADQTGSERGNLDLSRRRASTVGNQLVSLGVPPASIEVTGIGSTDPLARGDATERARINRSVSFIVRARPLARTGAGERPR